MVFRKYHQDFLAKNMYYIGKKINQPEKGQFSKGKHKLTTKEGL